MKRIREIFLTQYIGAIVIGMLVVQGLAGLISLLVQPIVWYQQRSSHSSFETFPWGNMLPALVSIGLYFVASYLFLAWLYPAEREALVEQEKPLEKPEDE